MPDRTIPPKISKIEKIDFPLPEKHILSNGTPLWVLNAGAQEIVKLDIFFDAGRPYEKKKMIARATSKLLTEGTDKHTANEIAEILDFHGATLTSPVDLDTSSLILYTLEKYFEKMLSLLCDILSKPSFPETELQLFKSNTKQKLKYNNSKCDVRAYRKITEEIFGPDHPYGYNSSNATIDDISRADLIDHFEQFYHKNNCNIIVSGQISSDTIELIDKYISQTLRDGKKPNPILRKTPSIPSRINDYVDEAVQSSIRIGKSMFKRGNEDYNGMYVLNTIFGGYFGSRLMMNIRENKGYTYNIFSSSDSMVFDGYFYIGTEVDNEYAEKTIEEIYHEMERLKIDLVGSSELEMVRNYLMGNMLTMVDGPMNSSEVVKSFLINEIPFQNFNELIFKIQTIQAEELRNLAIKYFKKEEMWEVVSGGIKN